MYFTFLTTFSLLLTAAVTESVGSSGPALLRRNLDYSDRVNLVAMHNTLRSTYSVPPLKWDKALAAGAQSYAKKCKTEGSNSNGQTAYGENIHTGNRWSSAVPHHFKKWEKNENNVKEMVWQHTEKFGCGLHYCGGRKWSLVCRYFPPSGYVPPPEDEESVIESEETA